MISVTPEQDLAACMAICMFMVASGFGLGAWNRRVTCNSNTKGGQKPPELWT